MRDERLPTGWINVGQTKRFNLAVKHIAAVVEKSDDESAIYIEGTKEPLTVVESATGILNKIKSAYDGHPKRRVKQSQFIIKANEDDEQTEASN